MGYDLNKHKVMLCEHQQNRIFFKRQTIIRFTFPLAVMFSVFVLLSMMAPAFAAPQPSSVMTPCAIYLPSSSTRFSQNAADKAKTHRIENQRIAGQFTMPVQLGFLLGARHALMPHNASDATKINKSHSSQSTAPEKYSGKYTVKGNQSHALAIAAYRSCQKSVALKQQRTARQL